MTIGTNKHIFLCDRGLTIIGSSTLEADYVTGMLTLYDAQVVIRWGTTGHLAELAGSGPRKETVLGELSPIMLLSRSAIVAVYPCNVSAWGDAIMIGDDNGYGDDYGDGYGYGDDYGDRYGSGYGIGDGYGDRYGKLGDGYGGGSGYGGGCG